MMMLDSIPLDSGTVTIGAVCAAIGLALKIGAQYRRLTEVIRLNTAEAEKHSEQIASLQTILQQLVIERRTDNSALRAQIAGVPTIINGSCKVLVVDDSEDDRFLFNRMLSPSFIVELASTMDEALQMFQLTKYDCVLLDLRMAGMNGRSTVETFVGRQPAALCVVLTGSIDPSEHASALAYGADMILLKTGAVKEYVVSVIRDAIIKKRLRIPLGTRKQ